MANTFTYPALVWGAWAWGDAGVFGNSLTEEDFRPVFEKAMASGLNLWDTAYCYGMGSSETILGHLLAGKPRDSFILSTKFTPQIRDEAAADPIGEMFAGSEQRLGVDHIEIYWIHNNENVERWTKEIIPLAKAGKIDVIGVSNHDLAEIKRANEILQAEGLRVGAVQNHYSMLNRSSEYSGIVDYCLENDIAFFDYMVLEQGALSEKYNTKNPFPEGSERAQVYNDKLPEIEKFVAEIKPIAASYDASVAEFAIAWAIAKKTLPIIGVTTMEQVDAAAKAAKIVVSEEDMAKVDEICAKYPINTIRYWEKEMK